MARFSPFVVIPPALFAGLAAMFYFGTGREGANELPSQLIGKPAPAVSLVQLGDTPLLTDAVLKAPGVKMVNFWGTWCVACRAEHPTLLWMKDNLDVPLHGVNFDDKTANALKYLAEEGNPFATLGEAKTPNTKIDWGVYGAPETFIIDGNGVVVLRWAGPITQRALTSDILPAIEKARAATAAPAPGG